MSSSGSEVKTNLKEKEIVKENLQDNSQELKCKQLSNFIKSIPTPNKRSKKSPKRIIKSKEILKKTPKKIMAKKITETAKKP